MKKNILSILIFISVALAIIFRIEVVNFGQKFFTGTSVAFSFIYNPSYDLKQDNGRTNLLILGTGGGSHDGPNLSDTMIVASFSYDKKESTLISIPRDVWIDGLQAKINAAYAYGEDRGKGRGLPLAEKTISELLGIPVHYGLRIDFAGFEKAIDTVSGIDVNVDRTFDDFTYPVDGKENDMCGNREKEIEEDGQKKTILVDPNDTPISTESAYFCRYQHLHFDAGLEHMDGVTALRYVRSRKGNNEEGTDFARSRRQQKVMMAFRDKVFSLGTITNPQKIISLVSEFGESVDTDIKASEISDFYKTILPSLKDGKAQTYVISSEENSLGGGLLQVGDSLKYGAWVLVPKDSQKTKDEVQKLLWPPQDIQEKK